jgi:DNA-binding response OmpR family regulator
LDGDVWIDLIRREITFKNATKGKQMIKLTPTEAKLMQVFFQHPKVVFSHSQLVAQVQGYEIKEWEAAEVLRPLVSRLRQKLSQVPGGKDWIVSIRGTGYVLELNVP